MEDKFRVQKLIPMLVKPLVKTFGVLIYERNKLYMHDDCQREQITNEMIIKLNVLVVIMKNHVGSSVGSDNFITVEVEWKIGIAK